MAWRHQPEEMPHWRGEWEETMSIRLTQILLGQKMKKIYAVDSAGTNGRWRFKAAMSEFIFKKTYVIEI
jgi:hypothetical protein